MYTEKDYIMWLSSVESIVPRKANIMLEYFGSAKDIWFAPKRLLETMPELTEVNVCRIVESRNEKVLEKRIDELDRKGIKFITRNNRLYPVLLKEIFDPPVGLYILGDMPDERFKKVSVVGARKCTAYGSQNAYDFSRELAESDIVIVSGMAQGIDGMAHKGALDGKGKTIAVLGNGVDICYPAVNRELREKILLSGGCLISEYAPGTKPLPAYFPVRNRIISGLSDVTVVIEAALKSGTLITVGQALEQGRDVFALPGNINSNLSKGTNSLLKQGAYVLTEAEDIFNILGIEKKKNNKINNKKITDSLATEEKLVYDCISLEPVSVDEMVIKTEMNVQSLQYILTMLELKGIIRRISGQKYIRS